MCAPCSSRSLMAICAARGTESSVTFPFVCAEENLEAWLQTFASLCVKTTAAAEVVTPLRRKLRLVQLIVSLLLALGPNQSNRRPGRFSALTREMISSVKYGIDNQQR